MISRPDDVWRKYNAIHMWIRSNYGSANHCSNPDCKKTSENYQWALIPGLEHDHNIDNYEQLCVPCHRQQDITPEWLASIKKAHAGVPKTEEHKQKISESMLEYWRVKKMRKGYKN